MVFSLAGVSGCLRAVLCVCACACGRVCVCVCGVLSLAFVALSVFLRCLCCCGGPFGAWLLVFVSSEWVGFPVLFPGGFRQALARHIGGRTSPRLVRFQFRKSSKLRAQQISRAKVSRTHFPR